MERYKKRQVRLYFRGDAAFASPYIYDYLEAQGMLYAIRLPANKVLQESIAYLLRHPVRRPLSHVRRYMSASTIRPDRGPGNAAWSPRLNGIPVNCIPASSSSSPT